MKYKNNSIISQEELEKKQFESLMQAIGLNQKNHLHSPSKRKGSRQIDQFSSTTLSPNTKKQSVISPRFIIKHPNNKNRAQQIDPNMTCLQGTSLNSLMNQQKRMSEGNTQLHNQFVLHARISSPSNDKHESRLSAIGPLVATESVKNLHMQYKNKNKDGNLKNSEEGKDIKKQVYFMDKANDFQGGAM